MKTAGGPDRRREVERTGSKLGRHPQGVDGRRCAVLPDHQIDRIGGDKFLDEIGGGAVHSGGDRRRERRVRQIGGDEALELGDELLHALRREVQGEQLDGHGPVAHGVVRPEYGAKSAGTNLMENTKRSERVRWCRARSFGVQ